MINDENLWITDPHQIWAADITYIGIQHGFVYLAGEEVYLWEYRTLANDQIRLPFFI